MKYFVSDTKKLSNKYGKWYWYADDECQVHINKNNLVIYGGYTIGREIDDIVSTDPKLLESANGTFWAVILTKNSAQVIVDYFCQTKMFYRDKDCIEFTNAIYLFPFTKDDIDLPYIIKILSVLPKEKLNYEPSENFERWEEMITSADGAGALTDAQKKSEQLKKYYVGGKFYLEGKQYLDIKQYSKARCATVFKDTWLLEPNHTLKIIEDRIIVERIHFSYNDNMTALSSESKFKTHEQLEDYIHKCMREHADIIKKKYKNIVSSISEGIDSVLQDAYFPEAHRVMYSYVPTNAPFEYKEKIAKRIKAIGGSIRIDHIDISTPNIVKMTKESVNDPTTFYWDCLPSFWQINQLDSKPDVVLYGQGGDQMFLHRAYYFYEYMLGLQIPKKISIEDKITEFNKTLKDLDDCYSGRDNIWQGNKAKTWRDCFTGLTEEEFRNELKNKTNDDWKDDFAKEGSSPYNREIAHNTDTLVTSLFCDKRIFHSIMNAPKDIMIDNIKNVTTQKNILIRKFQTEFETPFKDQAEINAIGMRDSLYKDVLRNCLKKHLPEA